MAFDDSVIISMWKGHTGAWNYGHKWKVVVKLFFLAQLSCCAYTITFRKPYIAIMEIWTIGTIWLL